MDLTVSNPVATASPLILIWFSPSEPLTLDSKSILVLTGGAVLAIGIGNVALDPMIPISKTV
jgi:hypothetical protein